MQWSVGITVELDPAAGLVGWEQAVQDAGREAMRQALAQAVRAYEEQHLGCPACGSAQSQSQGTVRRRVRTCFGRVELGLRRRRCRGCQRRFRPAAGCLVGLRRGQVTPELAAACALAGASWPYATAARVLHRLSGAQVSAEQVRHHTHQTGDHEAQAQQAEAARLLQPTAAPVRAEREAQDRADREQRGRHQAWRGPAPTPPAPDRLLVGLDGGWVPSREQPGGMEGKVGVVATGVVPVGTHGRQRLTPRRYVATFGSSEQVGTLAGAAAVALDGYAAGDQLVLGDGAEWIKTQAVMHFPDAVGILDWAQVARVVHKAIRTACPGPAQRARRRELHQQIPDALWHGEVDAALTLLRALRPAAPAEPVAVLEDTLRYVEGRYVEGRYVEGQRRWLGDYAAWQEAGYPIGSGCIERAVAIVINWRMKKRGMRWGRSAATALVALRVRALNAAWKAPDPPAPLAA
jgi:hypothetical protein